MIVLTYGTRPEYIKIKPIIDEFNKRGVDYLRLFTGQHKDLVSIPNDWELIIQDKPNRLDAVVGSIILQLWELFHYNNVDYVLVQGDTSTALAVALSTFHHGVKVIHLEAGLRTYDKENPYPEETNRRLISHITDIHLCPTPLNMMYLEEEKILGMKYVVGNTVIDNLLPYKDKCEYGNKILVTMHRRENHHWLSEWFNVIDNLAKEFQSMEFILPLHPNPNVQKHKNLLKHVKVVDPLSHEEFLNLLTEVKAVITDSGGIQEECSFLNKKCFVCRKVTERPEVINTSSILVYSPEVLENLFKVHIMRPEINYDCPYGDGHAAEKITDILMNLKNE